MTAVMRRLPVFACATLLLCSCARKQEMQSLSPQDSLAIVQDNLAHRAGAERFFATDPESPFQVDTTTAFTGLQWFPVDPRFRGESLLHRYERPETVTVMGTRGEERRQIRFGWFDLAVPGDDGPPLAVTLNAYRSLPEEEEHQGAAHLSVWFTDRTTGRETYHVGRYVEVGNVDPDPGHLYTIDLNKAYNPFCAYSDIYTCAVPRQEDHLDVALRVGEKTYGKHHASDRGAYQTEKDAYRE